LITFEARDTKQLACVYNFLSFVGIDETRLKAIFLILEHNSNCTIRHIVARKLLYVLLCVAASSQLKLQMSVCNNDCNLLCLRADLSELLDQEEASFQWVLGLN